MAMDNFLHTLLTLLNSTDSDFGIHLNFHNIVLSLTCYGLRIFITRKGEKKIIYNILKYSILTKSFGNFCIQR
jgi:hypothetical protein